MKPLAVAALVASIALGCQSKRAPEQPAPGSGDTPFDTLASFVLKAHYQRHPSDATDLGIHLYDPVMDDAAPQTIEDETGELRSFRDKLAAIDPATLTPGRQLDREQLIHAMDAGILANSVIRTWAKDPDFYSGGVTRAAYVIMKRKFAARGAGANLRFMITYAALCDAAAVEVGVLGPRPDDAVGEDPGIHRVDQLLAIELPARRQRRRVDRRELVAERAQLTGFILYRLRRRVVHHRVIEMNAEIGRVARMALIVGFKNE